MQLCSSLCGLWCGLSLGLGWLDLFPLGEVKIKLLCSSYRRCAVFSEGITATTVKVNMLRGPPPLLIDNLIFNSSCCLFCTQFKPFILHQCQTVLIIDVLLYVLDLEGFFHLHVTFQYTLKIFCLIILPN